MWPFISGKTTDSPRKDIPISHKTLISGDYKILTGIVILASWTGPQYPSMTHSSGRTYAFQNYGNKGGLNIKEDLAKMQPDMLRDMQQKLAKYQATYFNTNRGKVQHGASTTAINTYGGFWGPFLP